MENQMFLTCYYKYIMRRQSDSYSNENEIVCTKEFLLFY